MPARVRACLRVRGQTGVVPTSHSGARRSAVLAVTTAMGGAAHGHTDDYAAGHGDAVVTP